MNTKQLLQLLKSHTRPTRELILTPGDAGLLPVTKISGVPWWPRGISRPVCSSGHFLTFHWQILLSDLPSNPSDINSILSFHYCQQCMYEGAMAWGDEGDDDSRFDLRIFEKIEDYQVDQLSTLAEVVMEPSLVSFRNVDEVPDPEDVGVALEDIPSGYFQAADDFDEDVHPGIKHVMRSKLGGWPSWVQGPQWPESNSGESHQFVGQLDCIIGDLAAWGRMGKVYLFFRTKRDTPLKACFRMQTS